MHTILPRCIWPRFQFAAIVWNIAILFKWKSNELINLLLFLRSFARLVFSPMVFVVRVCAGGKWTRETDELNASISIEWHSRLNCCWSIPFNIRPNIAVIFAFHTSIRWCNAKSIHATQDKGIASGFDAYNRNSMEPFKKVLNIFANPFGEYDNY